MYAHKAILVRYVPCSSFKGARLVATAEGGHRLTIAYPDRCGPGAPAFWQAAHELAVMLGWSGTYAAGAMPKEGYVFVPIEEGCVGTVRKVKEG